MSASRSTVTVRDLLRSYLIGYIIVILFLTFKLFITMNNEAPVTPEVIPNETSDIQATMAKLAEAVAARKQAEVDAGKKKAADAKAMTAEVLLMAEGNKKLSENAIKHKSARNTADRVSKEYAHLPQGFFDEIQKDWNVVIKLDQEIRADETAQKQLEESIKSARKVLEGPDVALIAEAEAKLETFKQGLQSKREKVETLRKEHAISVAKSKGRWTAIVAQQEANAKDPMAFAVKEVLASKSEEMGGSGTSVTEPELMKASKEEVSRRIEERQEKYEQEVERLQRQEIGEARKDLEATRTGEYVKRLEKWIGIVSGEGADEEGFLSKFETIQTEMDKLLAKKFWFNSESRNNKRYEQLRLLGDKLKALQDEALGKDNGRDEAFDQAYRRATQGRVLEIPTHDSGKTIKVNFAGGYSSGQDVVSWNNAYGYSSSRIEPMSRAVKELEELANQINQERYDKITDLRKLVEKHLTIPN